MTKTKKDYLEVILTLGDTSQYFYFDKAQTLENFLKKYKYEFYRSSGYSPSMIIGHSIRYWTSEYPKDRTVRNGKIYFENVLRILRNTNTE